MFPSLWMEFVARLTFYMRKFLAQLILTFAFNIGSVIPVRLGCTSDSSFRGYLCNDGCRQEVEVVGSGKRNLCVHCCSGQGCNKIGRLQKGGKGNSTMITGNLAHKLNRSETEQTGGNLGAGSDLRMPLVICVTSMFLSLFLHS